MNVVFLPGAFDQYVEWQTRDKAILRKINGLIEECRRHPFEGTGKPEALRGNYAGGGRGGSIGNTGWSIGSRMEVCSSRNAGTITEPRRSADLGRMRGAGFVVGFPMSV